MSEEKVTVMENLLWKNSITVLGGDDQFAKLAFAANIAVHVRAGQDMLGKRFPVPEPRTVNFTCHSKARARAAFELMEKCQRTLGVPELDIPLMSLTAEGKVVTAELVSDLPTASAMSNTFELRILDLEYPGEFLEDWALGFQQLAAPDAANPDGVALLIVSPVAGKVPKPLADAAETVLNFTRESKPGRKPKKR